MISETTSIRELRTETNAVLSRLAAGPVVIMNRSTPQGVIVSIEEWNQIEKDREYIKLIKATFQQGVANT